MVAAPVATLEEVAVRCRAMGAEAQTFACDVTKDAQVAQMAAEVTALWGAPDVLVNNVGISYAFAAPHALALCARGRAPATAANFVVAGGVNARL